MVLGRIHRDAARELPVFSPRLCSRFLTTLAVVLCIARDIGVGEELLRGRFLQLRPEFLQIRVSASSLTIFGVEV